MSLGSWEGLDGARAERLCEASSEEEEEEWSSSEKECFLGVSIESSPSACSARSAYSEELSLSLEKNMSMARDGQEAEREGREGAP